MIIVWRGRGLVIALVAITCVGFASALTTAIAGDRYVQRHAWWGLVGFWTAAAVVHALRDWLGVGRKRTFIDKTTGREVSLACESALLFVPARF